MSVIEIKDVHFGPHAVRATVDITADEKTVLFSLVVEEGTHRMKCKCGVEHKDEVLSQTSEEQIASLVKGLRQMWNVFHEVKAGC